MATIAELLASGQTSTRTAGDNAVNLATTAFTSTAVSNASTASQMPVIGATVASNALTITLNSSGLPSVYRNPTLTNGSPVTATFSSTLSITVPSTATLGTVSGQQAELVVLELYNGGTPAIAVVNMSGGLSLDETGLISTTAISTSATSNAVIYSNSAITNSPFRVRGYILITEATAGTWATAPTLVQGAGGQALAAMQSFGIGQTWQNVTGSRAFSTTYYNLTARPIQVAITATASPASPLLNFIINGSTVVSQGVAAASSGSYSQSLVVVVPPGASYSATNTASGSLSTWYELR